MKSCEFLVKKKGFKTLTESLLGGGFKDFLFLPLPGEMIQFD